ncbi:MAG: DHH family phosphoesterase, partial [Clostridia bacterium]|nr:DHH family phosphoesterase [Clostridia bacterium]
MYTAMTNHSNDRPLSAQTEAGRSEAVRFFSEGSAFLIYTHNVPDGDTLGSAAALVLGLRALGKTAFAWNRDGIPTNLSFLNEGEPFLACPPDEERKAFRLVSVDVASDKMISPEDRMVFDLSIDHHAGCTIPCRLLYREPTYPAAGQMVFEILKDLGVPMSREIASALYAAVSSDTGGFRYDSTMPSTMRAAAELLETGIDFARINRLLFDCKSVPQTKIEGVAGGKVRLFYGGLFAMFRLTEEEIRSCGALEEDMVGLNDIPRRIAGVELSAFIRPRQDTLKCSFRSNDKANAGRLAESLGGGGHFHAASFCLPSADLTPEEMEALVL